MSDLSIATTHLQANGAPDASLFGMIGRSSALQQILNEVEMVAQTDATVLLYGETGTGKELVAEALHRRSTRVAAPSSR